MNISEVLTVVKIMRVVLPYTTSPLSLGFQTRPNIKQAARPQTIAKDLKFWFPVIGLSM